MLLQKTTLGEEHGLLNVLPNNCPGEDAFKNMKPELKAEAEKQRKHDSKVVHVKYVNYKNKAFRLQMPYCKYAGDNIQLWKFIHGKTYQVPRGLVDQVNTKKLPPKRAGLVSEDGENLQRSGAPIEKDIEGDRIHEFVSVNF